MLRLILLSTALLTAPGLAATKVSTFSVGVVIVTDEELQSETSDTTTSPESVTETEDDDTTTESDEN